MGDYERRIDRLEAMLGPSVDLKTRHFAEGLAALVGWNADELIAEAATIATTEAVPAVLDDERDAFAAKVAVVHGRDVDDVRAELDRLEQLYG